MTNRKGIALISILFMAFIVGIIMVVMIKSNSNLSIQNKTTLRNLQAYYLAQSGIQHALLKLRLLPKECYEVLEKGLEQSFFDVSSDSHKDLVLKPSEKAYDLFSQDPPDDISPYRGSYSLTTLSLNSANKGMRYALDGYSLEVESEVYPLSPKNNSLKFTEKIAEEILISRFTGGLGGS